MRGEHVLGQLVLEFGVQLGCPAPHGEQRGRGAACQESPKRSPAMSPGWDQAPRAATGWADVAVPRGGGTVR